MGLFKDEYKCSTEKKKNIFKMYERTKQEYNGLNTEIAVVFKGSKIPEKIYDIDSAKTVKSDEPNSLNINEPIEAFLKEKTDNNAITAFHNHRWASSFTIIDVSNLFRYDYIYELYLDSGKYIRVLIKQWDESKMNTFSKQTEQVDTIIKELHGFYNIISKKYMGEYLKIIENDSLNSEKLKKAEEIADTINNEVFKEARMKGICEFKFNLWKLEKPKK